MGQRGTVKVEVLAMSGTAEETLLDVQAELAAAAVRPATHCPPRHRHAWTLVWARWILLAKS